MPAYTHATSGINVLFTTPAISGYLVQSWSISSAPANTIEVMDGSGNRCWAKYDDVTDTYGFTAVLLTATTLPTPGSSVTIAGTKYETLSVNQKGGNKEAVTVDISAKKSQYIIPT